jgi:hypothetical protein
MFVIIILSFLHILFFTPSLFTEFFPFIFR